MKSRMFFVTAAVALLVVGLTGAASAHTKPRIVAATPASSSAGATVAVTGSALMPEKAVEVRWDSVTGPVLGTASTDAEGTFAASVVVPAAAPGAYSLIVVSDGVGAARTAFEVVNPSARAGAQPVAVGLQAPLSRQAAPVDASASSDLVSAMLAVGLVVLFSVLALVGLHRRRALAHNPTPTPRDRTRA